MAGDFFVQTLYGWLGPGCWGTFSDDPQWGSILKISKSKFTVIKGSLNSFKSQNFYFIIVTKEAPGFEMECTDCLVKMFSTNLDCT